MISETKKIHHPHCHPDAWGFFFSSEGTAKIPAKLKREITCKKGIEIKPKRHRDQADEARGKRRVS